jgi:hypothetical protein
VTISRGLLALLGIIALVLVVAGATLGTDALWHLLLGWILFLLRVFRQINPDRNTVIAAIVAAVLFMGGVCAVAGKRLGLRGSVAVTVLMFVLFAAAVAMVGVVHQTGWISASPEPVRYQTVAYYESPANKLQQNTLAFHNYESHFGKFPAAGTYSPDGQALHSWELQILPFGSIASARDVDTTLPWNHPTNAKYFQTIIPEFTNPRLSSAPLTDADGFGLDHYAANSHILRVDKEIKLADMLDGTANTILLGEVNSNFSPWGRPLNVRDPAKGINKSPNGFGGPRYLGGAHFGMVDGSARFVSDKVSPAVMKALATPNGGEEFDPAVLEASRRFP